MAQEMPNLEQLWFTDLLIPAWDGHQGTTKGWLGGALGRLKVVICEGVKDSLKVSEAFGLVQLASVNQGSEIQHLEIMPYHEDPKGATILGQYHEWMGLVGFLSRGTFPPEEPNSFDNLRTLRLKRMLMDGAASEPLLRNAIDNGKLRNIDINFPRATIVDVEGPASCERIEEFSWLRGAESIHCISLSNFRFRRYPQNDEDLPLPSFLASFPNLETLEIGSEYYDDAELGSVIVAIMKVTKLKRIYQNTIKGTNLDILKAAAKQLDIELVWGERPREWPVPIDE